MKWQKYVAFNPDVCHVKAHIKDTRVMISVILDFLAEKMMIEELLTEYPSLREE
ncbi:MAG: hypothetical protein BAJALOKI1v1_1230011 [Promethearchaeota archaeon]|nr:MAG: hypothetical protein BAJALOKI1v1_1230011 [Candidatus Lokiarchaeota archaeon]